MPDYYINLKIFVKKTFIEQTEIKATPARPEIIAIKYKLADVEMAPQHSA
jgi:hypothetical protein